MVFSATLHAAGATIFIAANVMLCQKTDASNKNHRNRNVISTDENSTVDPLPPVIFNQPLTDLLSPEIFSQSDPLDHFLAKAIELSEIDIRTINLDVKYQLDMKRFPQHYIPYAKVVSSLLPCLIKLKRVKSSIIEIQNDQEFNYSFPPSNTPTPDARFTSLFSRDVFADDKLPSVILRKLLDVPDEKITRAIKWLQMLLKSDSYFSQDYHRYINELFTFLDGNARYELKRLRCRLAVLQRTISTFNSSDSNQPKV